jgi:hypothetical protein
VLSNPIPDGQPRLHQIELVDGFMTEQHWLTLILRERAQGAGAGPSPWRYMYVTLQHTDERPELPGAVAEPVAQPAAAAPERTCDGALIHRVSWRSETMDAATLTARLTDDVISRLALSLEPGYAPVGDDPVHALCVWETPEHATRAVINGGPSGDIPCPVTARVIYFHAPQWQPGQWDCHDATPETCLAQLQRRLQTTQDLPILQPADAHLLGPDAQADFLLGYRCANGQATCEFDPHDPTAGRVFHRGLAQQPLAQEVADAFGYRAQFMLGPDSAIGFAPEICRSADFHPYCVRTHAIDALQKRMDCARTLIEGTEAGLLPPELSHSIAPLRALLAASYGGPEGQAEGALGTGFETLNAELHLLLGDDAYARALNARHGSTEGVPSFDGAAFDADGVEISGLVGAEMTLLHQADQHYTLVIERFFDHTAQLDEILPSPPPLAYLAHVARACTQQAVIADEIARRHQALHHPAAALRAVAPSYDRALAQWGALDAHLARARAASNTPAAFDATHRALQHAHQLALLGLQSRYQALQAHAAPNDRTADFVPLPPLAEGDPDGFSVALGRTRHLLERAREAHSAAEAAYTSPLRDPATLRQALTAQRDDIQGRLGTLCGTFEAADGRSLPVIKRTQHLIDPAGEPITTTGDPCGALGTGALWEAAQVLEAHVHTATQLRQRKAAIEAALRDNEAQIQLHCDLAAEVRPHLQRLGVISPLGDDLARAALRLEQLAQHSDRISARQLDGPDAPWSQAERLSSAQPPWSRTVAAQHPPLGAAITTSRDRLRAMTDLYGAFDLQTGCDYLSAEGGTRERGLHLALVQLELNALEALRATRAALEALHQAYAERVRLDTAYAATQRLADHIATGRRDPTVRLYRDAATLHADHSRAAAIAAAWDTTRVHEYYTASTYAARGQLHTIRQIASGATGRSLDRYVDDLEDAFLNAQQQQPNQDARIQRASLRDDILRIRRYDTTEDGAAQVRSAAARTRALRQRLAESAQLSADGTITVEFATHTDLLAPQTSDHLIERVEVILIGRALGDDLRVQLRHMGAGTLRDRDGHQQRATLPPRTAVLHPVIDAPVQFNQRRLRSEALSDRPLIQSRWQLVLDLQQAPASPGLNLGGLEDIEVLMHYRQSIPLIAARAPRAALVCASVADSRLFLISPTLPGL